MRASIRKLKSKFTSKMNSSLRGAPKKARKTDGAKNLTQSVSRWMDRSKDFIGTLPTVNELREEFADWHSFEPLDLNELNINGSSFA